MKKEEIKKTKTVKEPRNNSKIKEVKKTKEKTEIKKTEEIKEPVRNPVSLTKKIVLTTLSFAVISLSSLGLYLKFFHEITVPIIENKEEETPKEVWPKEYSFNLLGTGDALLHNPVYDIALQPDGSYVFDDVFEFIGDTIKEADLSYINQETVFADSMRYSSYPLFNTPSDWGDALINYGFDLISLANNHSMDMGGTGAKESIAYWESKDVYASGMASSLEKRDNIKIETVNGISYAFLSYTYGTNGMPVPSGEEYLVNLYSKELAESHIESVRDQVDVIIVAMHWGNEYNASPNTYQTTVANELAEMDVDIILGNHPHWMQPIDIIDETVVVYSMGNFISNQMIIANQSPYTWSVATGCFVTMDVNKTVYEDGTTEIDVDNINVELLFNYKSPQRTYKIIPFDQMNESYHYNYVSLYETHKERMTSLSDEVTVSPLINEETTE